MKCPCCGGETESGYLQSSRSIVWSRRILSGVILPRDENDFVASEGKAFQHLIPSEYCAACHMLFAKEHGAK